MKKLIAFTTLFFTLATPAKAQEASLNQNVICEVSVTASNIILNAQGVADLSSIGLEPLSGVESVIDNNPNTADVMYSLINPADLPKSIYDWRTTHIIFWAHETLDNAINSQEAFNRQIVGGAFTQLSQCANFIASSNDRINGEIHEIATFSFFNNGQEFLASLSRPLQPSYQLVNDAPSTDLYVNALWLAINTYNSR